MSIEIQILSAPGCTTCEQVKALVQKFVEQETPDFTELSYKTIDVVESPEIGARYGVLSIPAIVINDILVFRGVPKKKALRKKLESLRIPA